MRGCFPLVVRDFAASRHGLGVNHAAVVEEVYRSLFNDSGEGAVTNVAEQLLRKTAFCCTYPDESPGSFCITVSCGH